jgi:hypothetical protein
MWHSFFFIVQTLALHYTLKHQDLILKHLKFAFTCFGLLWNHPQRVHGPTSVRYWTGICLFTYVIKSVVLWPYVTQCWVLFCFVITEDDGSSRNFFLICVPEVPSSNRDPSKVTDDFNPLNAEIYPICCLLALLGTHHFLHVSRIRVNGEPQYRQASFEIISNIRSRAISYTYFSLLSVIIRQHNFL